MIQADQFLKLLEHPEEIPPEAVIDLKDALYQYPYFQAAYALIARASYDTNAPGREHAVQTAAIYATDRDYLKALLQGAPPFSASLKPPPPEKEKQEALVADTEDTQIQQAPEAYEFINGYVNNIRQKAKKKITKKKILEQLELIQAFTKKGTNFKSTRLQDESLAYSQVDLTQGSTTLYDDLITESLAQVLFQQGKVQRALDIYAKLMLKFPEKKRYFASLIEELKT